MMKTIKFGPNKKMKLGQPLDTWLTAGLRDFAVPEAVGSSARVFALDYKPLNGDFNNYPAIKIMRPDKLDYALPLFRNEIQILDQMQDVEGITPLLGVGYLKVEEGVWPKEIAPLSISLENEASAANLAGIADLYNPQDVEVFLDELDERVPNEWLAFLITPRRWEDNLYLRCDAGYTRGDFHLSFPMVNGLMAAVQMVNILQAAHDKNIVYLDHKILHYYWNEPRQQVYVLDWNIGRQVQNGDAREVYEFDILQFSARALHHLLTGRQAPGSLKVGPNKPEDIQNAPHTYEPVWTYDDQKRLTEDEMNVLGQAIQGKFKTTGDLAGALQKLYNQRQSQA
jgi:hypothetical protein